MPTNNRNATRSRGGRNNNPEGRNQYSGLIGTARGNPLTAAVAIGGAVAAGVFLWSRRNQLGDQIGSLSDQISEWRDGMGSSGEFGAEDARSNEEDPVIGSDGTGAHKSQSQIAEEALTLKETGKAVS